MPNTPCLVSEGAAGFSLGSHATSEDRDMVLKLMGAVGLACEVKEPLLDGEGGIFTGKGGRGCLPRTPLAPSFSPPYFVRIR